MPRALEQIQRMRGGAQSHLMRCADGHYYVVKFQNNPQHRRILVNELLGTRLAARLGLPTVPVAIIDVPEELIRLTPELAMEHPRSRIPCLPGAQFGSRYPGDPRRLTLHDFLPDQQLREVENLHDFAGMLVFDKWTCNTNGRQTLFLSPLDSPGDQPRTGYRTIMIDQGFCFSAGDWRFPDAPLRGLYARNRVYEGVTGMESFGPWLERLEKRITERVLDDASRDIPPEWYEDDYDELLRLLEQIYRRRTRVPELLLDAKRCNRQPFPNWVCTMTETVSQSPPSATPGESACAYRVLRYTPNLVRDEWVNIGILLFNPATGERRLRLIEDEEEYRRVRRLHPHADEPLLRALRNDLEDRFQTAGTSGSSEFQAANGGGAWQQLLAKWDDTLSNALQLAPQKGVFTTDLDAELERLYADHVALQAAPGRVGLPGSRARVRSYCSQVFRQAHLWERIEKSVRAEQWTLPGDPLRLDYSYRRNGTLGFVHTFSVTRAPGDFKQLAYTAERIHAKEKLKTEFAAVTDVPLVPGNKRDDFVAASLREVGIEPVPMEGFAVWVAKLKPLLLQ